MKEKAIPVCQFKCKAKDLVKKVEEVYNLPYIRDLVTNDNS